MGELDRVAKCLLSLLKGSRFDLESWQFAKAIDKKEAARNIAHDCMWHKQASSLDENVFLSV